jgi:hypothetical protein
MKNNERALQLWSVLVLAARHHEILSYHMIEKLTGIPKHAMGSYLDLVYNYCDSKEWPPLVILAVNERDGRPGTTFWQGKDIDALQARVFVFDWLKHKPPTPQDFKKSN